MGMAKMTSSIAPASGTAGDGILARATNLPNPFADWNQVHLLYCSSDSWAGSTPPMDVDATHVWYTLPAGEVYRVSRDGGAKEPVAVAQETPTEIVAGATDAVFWIAATRIYTAPK